MISSEAPVLFAKACEMFILELTTRAWVHAQESKRRTLLRSDIAAAITKTDIFDFLVDIVPREDFKQNPSGDPAGPSDAPPPPPSSGATPAARPRLRRLSRRPPTPTPTPTRPTRLVRPRRRTTRVHPALSHLPSTDRVASAPSNRSNRRPPCTCTPCCFVSRLRAHPTTHTLALHDSPIAMTHRSPITTHTRVPPARMGWMGARVGARARRDDTRRREGERERRTFDRIGSDRERASVGSNGGRTNERTNERTTSTSRLGILDRFDRFDRFDLDERARWWSRARWRWCHRR